MLSRNGDRPVVVSLNRAVDTVRLHDVPFELVPCEVPFFLVHTPAGFELIAAARRGARKAWRDGYAFTKAGIILDDLLPEDERPRTLFEGDTTKRDRLMGALDAINGKFGTLTAVTASQGFKRESKMRSEMRSPAWTTDISQVPTVRA